MKTYKVVIEGLDRTVTAQAPTNKQAGHNIWDSLTDAERAKVTDMDVSEITPRADEFMAAVHRIPAAHVSKALNLQTPGFNWNLCTKGFMAKEFEQACVNPSKAIAPSSMAWLNLDLLAAQARARMNGDKNWKEAA